MKSTFLYLSIISIICFSACSSKTSETNSANANSAVVSATNTGSTTSQPGTTQAKIVENINSSAFNSNPQNVRVVPVDPKNDKATSAIYGRNAPDDSTFSATMDAKGTPIEIRTFNNNQYLNKIERVFITPNKKILKVYLKSGKVVELSEDKLANFATAMPGNILEAVGINPAPQNQPANGGKSDEKKENTEKKP